MALPGLIIYLKFIIEAVAIIFLTFTFFDLIYVDKTIRKTSLGERFEIFKRYEIFRTALIYIISALYFFLLARLSVAFLSIPMLSDILVIIGDLFVIIFALSMYRMIRNYAISHNA